MEDAVNTLELEFKRVVCDLEFVSHRLDEASSRVTSDAPNIVSLVRRINGLETKLDVVKRKGIRLEEDRRAVVSATLSALLKNFACLNSIASELGVSSDQEECFDGREECRADLINAANACAFLKPGRAPSSASSSSSSSCSAAASSSSGSSLAEVFDWAGSSSSKENILSKTATLAEQGCGKGTGKGAAAKNMLDEASFEAIPISIRGRVKFATVVSLFSKLHLVHVSLRAMQPKNAAMLPMSLSELEAHGCKVTGKTGGNLLGSLKSLGLVSITPKGAVLLTKEALAFASASNKK